MNVGYCVRFNKSHLFTAARRQKKTLNLLTNSIRNFQFIKNESLANHTKNRIFPSKRALRRPFTKRRCALSPRTTVWRIDQSDFCVLRFPRRIKHTLSFDQPYTRLFVVTYGCSSSAAAHHHHHRDCRCITHHSSNATYINVVPIYIRDKCVLLHVCLGCHVPRQYTRAPLVQIWTARCLGGAPFVYSN